MAKKNDAKQDIKDLNKELGYIEDQIINIADSLSRTVKDAISDLKDEAASVGDIFEKKLSKSIKSLASDSETILANTLKLYEGSAKLSNIQKAQERLKLKELSLTRNLDILQNNGLLNAEERKQKEAEINDAISRQNILLKGQAELAKQIQSKMGVTGKVIESFTKIPLLGNLIDSERVLAKVQAEAASKDATKTSVFKAGLKETGKVMKENLLDPAVLLGGAFVVLVKLAKFFFDALLGASMQTAKFRRDFGLTNKEAEQLRQRTFDIAFYSKQYADTQGRILITQPQIVKSLEEINKALGTQIDFTKDLGTFGKQLLVQDAILRDNLQLDEETRAAINKESIRTGKLTEQITKNALGNVAAVGLQRKILLDNNKILTTASKITGELRSSFKGNVEEIAKGIAKLELMGLTLEQSKKIAGGLLNFEQSISAEIEAELLTGKDLNLERARLLAINRKYVELGQEIVNQGLTTNELNNMNSIQLDAQAAAYNLTSDELTDIVQKTEEYNALTARAAKEGKKVLIGEKTSLKDIYEQLQKQGVGEKEIVRILGDKLYAEKQAEDAQMKFNKALDQAKGSFERLVSSGVLDKLVDALTKFVNLISGGQAAVDQAADLEQQRKQAQQSGNTARVKELDKLITEQKQIAESSAKTGGAAKGAGMGIAAAIGGLLLGTVLIGTGAGAAAGIPLEAASLSTIAAALGTSAAVGGAYGYATSSAPKPKPTSIKTDDFTITTNLADTIVAAGGTNLGRTDEIVNLLGQILRKEGRVDINSSRFNTGLSLGNFKTQ
jgi:hypothetical protein